MIRAFLGSILDILAAWGAAFVSVWRTGSAGARVLLVLALASWVAMWLWPARPIEGTEMWLFAMAHERQYTPLVERWNAENPGRKVHLSLLSQPALQRRLLSGFFTGTPTAGLVEIERSTAPRTFAGPLESVGFVDLTDRIKAEGLDRQIAEASFSAWTSHGRVFGLPHDVHPVMLAYRSDVVEAAGIQLEGVVTWEEFFDRMRPLQEDRDGDGQPDRFILAFNISDSGHIDALMTQAGGGLFTADERPCIDSEVNVRVLARIVGWTAGPGRVSAPAPDFNASGNRLKVDGFVLASLMPDWLCGTWKADLPQLAGKLKVMPLPAWEPGGRRTTVFGGTMVGIPKAAKDFETCWAVAKHLYLSRETAEALFAHANIISPVKAHWSLPMYDQPDPYFSGQAVGRLYLEMVPEVPRRISSPFYPLALSRLGDAAVAAQERARKAGRFEPADLEGYAREALGLAQSEIERAIARNILVERKP